MTQDDTDFGYQRIPKSEKTAKVSAVFSSVAHRYDLMNDLMSWHHHHWWKEQAVSACGLRPGQTVLDLAGGTGDLTKRIAPKIAPSGMIYLADLTQAMLRAGRDKLINHGLLQIEYIQANAECLPFVDNSFDCITMGFGLRNVTDKTRALTSIYRCLKPGGRLVILEFSQPELGPLQKAYDWYSFSILPKLGQLIVGDEESYRYLAESIRRHPDRETLARLMTDCGFAHVTHVPLSAGIVAIHKGFKC